LTPLSATLWRIAPEMAFLQFPWRLTAVLAAVFCAGAALAAGRIKVSRPVAAAASLALVAAMALPAVHQFRQGCDDEDTVAARLAVFQAKTGTDPTDEYTPGEADNDSLQHANPPFWLADNPDAQPPQGRAGQAPMHFVIEAAKPEYLILNLRGYPAWRVRRNGEPVTDELERADGLIAIDLPAGRSQIDIAYAKTGDVRLGEGISLVALCVTLGVMVARSIRKGSRIIVA